MTLKPSLRNYLAAFWNDWGERMSGPPGVILMIVGFLIPNKNIGTATIFFGIICGLYATYRVWSGERNRVLELEKISRRDIERLAGGRFLQNTFICGGEVNICKRYRGKFEIDQLKDFDIVTARAPGNSWAEIRFSFNAPRGSGGKYAIYIRDGLGSVRAVESIYESQSVLLDQNAQFAIKVAYEELPMDDHTDLYVDLRSWTK
jgi:hypothetical protein